MTRKEQALREALQRLYDETKDYLGALGVDPRDNFAMNQAQEVLAETRDALDERVRIDATHEAADAFWTYWNKVGKTGKRGYFEATWGAINAALNVRKPTEESPVPQTDAAEARTGQTMLRLVKEDESQ